jgi:type IV secretory pathway VirB2 component (pilin)
MKYFLTFFSFFVLVTPVLVFAEFKPLVGIPGVENSEDFDQYLQSIYALAIGLAALLAVIKIVIAGVKWMTTDIVTAKGDAKSDIEGAVYGLILILGAVLILNIINPDIGKADLSFTPAPKSVAIPGQIELAAVRACKATTTCDFVVNKCPEIIATDGSTDPVYDCTDLQAKCLGEFSVSQTGREGACLTTNDVKAVALSQIASTNCPAGETCVAEKCSSLVGCGFFCTLKKGIYFDSITDVCVFSSPDQRLTENGEKIETLLAERNLSGRIITQTPVLNAFDAATGADKTYYLAELPATGFSTNAGNKNSSVISAMRQVCLVITDSALINGNADESDIKVLIETIGDKEYVGCVKQ